ncbi:MAG: hypothetical protein ACLFUO_06735 [Candidatus Woesearchaeota archaeon]
MDEKKYRHHVQKVSDFDYEKSGADKKAESNKHHTSRHKRDIDHKEDHKVVRKQQKMSSRVLIYFLMLIIVILGGLFAIRMFLPEPDDGKYNGFDCQEYGNFTYCRIAVQKQDVVDGELVLGPLKEYDLQFRNPPWELEDIPVAGNVSQLVNISRTKFIYLAIPGNIANIELAKIGIGAIEISRLLGDRYDIFNIESKSALITETVEDPGLYNDSDIPLVNCENATNSTAVMLFGYGDQSFVSKQGNCYIVAGKTADDVIRAADRLAYTVLGIMRKEYYSE